MQRSASKHLRLTFGVSAIDALTVWHVAGALTLGAIADAANRTTGVTDADLASTGLPAVKQRTQLTEPPEAPQNVRLRHGQMPGAVAGACDPIPGGNIRSYEGQWALDPVDGPWSETFTFPNSRSHRAAAAPASIVAELGGVR